MIPEILDSSPDILMAFGNSDCVYRLQRLLVLRLLCLMNNQCGLVWRIRSCSRPIRGIKKDSLSGAATHTQAEPKKFQRHLPDR